MPRSAMPPHLQALSGWAGTDWDTWYQRWMIRFKYLTAFGPRATEWWAKWRDYPITLFARSSNESYRLEDDFTDLRWWGDEPIWNGTSWYLSAIQYWSKWHVQLQWPLFFACHYYIDPVPCYPAKASSKHRVFYFRIGARRDADRVYWMPSLFIGLTFN